MRPNLFFLSFFCDENRVLFSFKEFLHRQKFEGFFFIIIKNKKRERDGWCHLCTKVNSILDSFLFLI